jgi:phospholipase C
MNQSGRRARRWARKTLLAGVVAATSVGVVGVGAAQAHRGKARGPKHTTSAPKHIFYIMEENHAYNQIIGNTQDAPFINRLASQNRVASDFHGVTHPSLPNYLAAVSGDFQGIFDDCAAGASITCAPEEFVPGSGDGTSATALTAEETAAATAKPHLFGTKNIVDQLEAKHFSWKAYMENLPSPGSDVVNAPVIGTTTVKLYAQKHNPFMYFSDINSAGNARLSKVVPFEGYFANDLQSGKVPSFSFIAPNQCHDMHGISSDQAALVNLPTCASPASGLDHGAIQLGDQWLQQTVTAIKQSAAWRKAPAEIIIAWDENDYSVDTSGGPFSPVGGPAPLIVVANRGAHHVVNKAPTDHYSTLYAIEHMWHLGCLANTCKFANGNAFMNLFNVPGS